MSCGISHLPWPGTMTRAIKNLDDLKPWQLLRMDIVMNCIWHHRVPHKEEVRALNSLLGEALCNADLLTDEEIEERAELAKENLIGAMRVAQAALRTKPKVVPSS